MASPGERHSPHLALVVVLTLFSFSLFFPHSSEEAWMMEGWGGRREERREGGNGRIGGEGGLARWSSRWV